MKKLQWINKKKFKIEIWNQQIFTLYSFSLHELVNDAIVNIIGNGINKILNEAV